MLEVKMNVDEKGNKTGPYIITICGSLRFTREMLQMHHELSNQGFMVFLPNINLEEPVPTGSSPKNEDAQTLHDAKISSSNAVLIMNLNGYIGESTFHEWKLARDMKKDIIWFHSWIKDEKIKEEWAEKTRKLLAKFDKKEKNNESKNA